MSKFWATNDSDSDRSSSSSQDSDSFLDDDDDDGSVHWSSSSSRSSSSGGSDTEEDLPKVDVDSDKKKKTTNQNKQDNDDEPLSSSFLLEGVGRCGVGDDVDNDGGDDDNVSDISSKDPAVNTDNKDDPNLDWERIKDDQVFLEPPRWQMSYTSNTTEKQEQRSFTRLVCISDTHAQHRNLPFLPKGDVLIHGGDFTKCGELGTVEDLNHYFGEMKAYNEFQQVICIAGNHDTTFHPEYYDKSERCRNMPFDCTKAKQILTNCTYLEDSTCFVGSSTTTPLEIYGSPWTPNFYDWAFMKPRGQPLSDIWSKIPTTTDVLITHGPPLGRNDETDHSGYTGCLDLLQEVQNRIQPRVHIFGHIHQGYGTSYDGTTLYVNASSISSESGQRRMNPPIVVDVPHDPTQSAYLVPPDCPVMNPYTLFTWLQYNHYDELVQHIEQEFCNDDDHWMTSSSLPLGNDLLKESAYEELCQLWLLHRHPSAQRELRYALCQLYAESFQ